MRQWSTRFSFIWLVALFPSLVFWGLLVRWNEAGPSRFVRFWDWSANRLAFPLIFDPITSPAEAWLTDRSGVLSALGFAILLAVWCVMLALPLSLLSSWMNWFGGRINPSRSVSIYDPASSIPIAETSSGSYALHVVTIPLALAWHGIRFFLPSAITTFLIVGSIRFAYLFLRLRHESYAVVSDLAAAMEHDRTGRFSCFGERSFFAHQWKSYYVPMRRLGKHFKDESWLFQDYHHHLFRYHYVIKLFLLDSALYGATAGIVIGLIALVLKTSSAWKSFSL